jgi:hypothetical protein
MIFPWDESIISQALDYRIDRPRVLALNVYPPAFLTGLPVELEALVLGPDGSEAIHGSWKTCGLEEDQPTAVWDLDCFGQDEGVEAIGEGIPGFWTPPSLDLDCDALDTGSYAWLGCSLTLPFVLQARLDGQMVRGSFTGSIHDIEGIEVPASFRDVALVLAPSPIKDGQVDVEATFGRACDTAVFRWYVDGGTLLDTGRTAIQGVQGNSVWSRNRWILPEGKGPFRIAVVISSYEAMGCETFKESFTTDVANMNWAVITVEGI